MTHYYANDPQEVRLSASAVVWRDAERRELLLMQRSDNAHWGLPGGYVEAGEGVADAASREVAEETGVIVAIERLVGVYANPATQCIAYPDGRVVQAINLCFEGVAAGNTQATTPQETLAIDYFAPDALPDPFVPIHRIRIEDVLVRDPVVRVR